MGEFFIIKSDHDTTLPALVQGRSKQTRTEGLKSGQNTPTRGSRESFLFPRYNERGKSACSE